MQNNLLIAVSAIMTALAVSCGKTGEIEPSSLTCEYMENPVIDICTPRLSWIDNVKDPNVKDAVQTAYRIVVSSGKGMARKGSGDIWDSGIVRSDESHLVSYGGPELLSGKDYWWAVKVWDGKGKESRWSSEGMFTTGIMDPSLWKASWIGAPWMEEQPGKDYPPAPVFRKSFDIDKKVSSARAYVCGLGYFEFHVNGKVAGDPDERLVPAFTDYAVRPDRLMNRALSLENNFSAYRTMYKVYDITRLLRKGKNAVAALVGNGYFDVDHDNRKMAAYGTPRLFCQIEITYTDGTSGAIVSSTDWKTAKSPVIWNDLYLGEAYDASAEIPHWDTASCDDSTWENAVTRKAPDGPLTVQTAPSDKILERLEPKSLQRLGDGSWKVDFGKVISGWINFRGISGKSGDTLKVYFPSDDGKTRYNGTNELIFKDSSPIDYAPKFTWFVFRDAVISGIDNLKKENLVAECVGTVVLPNAEFHCSEQILEDIEKIWRQSMVDNMHGCVASDCPHRERLPYTGDGEIEMNTVLANFDAAAFYNKWLVDIRNSRDTLTGYVPNGAPWEPFCGGGIAWGAAIDIMPWEFYLRYGDRKVLEDNYVAMKDYIRYIELWKLPDGTVFTRRTNPGEDKPEKFFNLGEWVPAYDLPDDNLVHTFYYWYCADIVSKAAKELGIGQDAIQYTRLADSVREAFIKKFHDPANETFGDFGANVFALVMGLPEDMEPSIVRTLRKEIMETHGGHLHTGMLSTRFLLETLSEHGLGDVAYTVMTRKDYPSFGYMLENGATVTWEQFDGGNSRNHPFLGGCLTWLYKNLCGVDTDPSAPGFRHFTVRPLLPSGISSASYSSESPYGKVESRVSREGGTLTVAVTVPVGCKATVILPGKAPIETAQGTYTFTAQAD